VRKLEITEILGLGSMRCLDFTLAYGTGRDFERVMKSGLGQVKRRVARTNFRDLGGPTTH